MTPYRLPGLVIVRHHLQARGRRPSVAVVSIRRTSGSGRRVGTRCLLCRRDGHLHPEQQKRFVTDLNLVPGLIFPIFFVYVNA